MIVPQIFKEHSIISAAMSTKQDADEALPSMNLQNENDSNNINLIKLHKDFFTKMNISIESIAKPIQCHSNEVTRVNEPGEYPNCDALITNITGVALIVTVADCVPIMLYDPICKAIAIIHAGWRGTVNNIVEKTITKMCNEFGSKPIDMLAYIGASAGVCCYEVSGEMVGMFENKVVFCRNQKLYIDLKEANRSQLSQQGVNDINIEVCNFCTICENKLFHSFRREGKQAGRMLAVICLKKMEN